MKKECILECYYDKDLQCCSGCFRTLAEIREAGISFTKEKEKSSVMCMCAELDEYVDSLATTEDGCYLFVNNNFIIKENYKKLMEKENGLL